jgi:nicotinic acid mononucleotide adenylyltransferase
MVEQGVAGRRARVGEARSLNWLRGVRAAVLLGAFDPPTNAHVAILRAAQQRLAVPGILCLTRVLLARPDDTLLEMNERLDVLGALAAAEGFGLCIAESGTYLDVARELRVAGLEPVFVIGSDKLPQLSDPSFYPDGQAGVDATFRDCDFLVIERGGDAPSDVFENPRHAGISATEVRRRVRAGEPVDDLVPPVVARALEGYTASG